MRARSSNNGVRSRGFSLVELMVAMVIAIIIIIGVVQIFASSRATYQLDEALARAQENGRFAMEFITQDVRHAGYLGCNRDVRRAGPSQLDLFKPFNFLVGAQRYTPLGITGFEFNSPPTGIGNTYNVAPFPITNSTAGWSPGLNTTLVPGSNSVPGAQPGTDVIAVEHMVPTPLLMRAPYVDRDFVYIDPSSVSRVNVDDVMLISDCRESAIFQVTGVTGAGVISHTTGGSGSPGNRCGQWEGALFPNANTATAECTNAFEVPQPNTMLGQLQLTVFYIANDPVTNRPTLYRNQTRPGGPPNPQAMVEGVENLQVLYGVDDVTPDGIADRYVPANLITNFALVTSVRIGLLVHGTNVAGPASETTSETDTFNVGGTIIDPNPADERLRRRVFSTTIQLRNRGF